MAASADQNTPRTAGDDRNLVTIDENYLAPSFEDKMLIFWEKNGRTVIAILVIVALAIIARWGFAMFAESRERAIAAEYAAAKDDAARRAFAQSHPTAPLAGVSLLGLADAAYAAGDFSAAQADYDAAAKILPATALGDRARLGSGLSKLQAGDAAGAKSILESLANDPAFTRSLRGEAGFHLAVMARDAGQIADANKWVEQVLATDPSGLWAQRSMMLRSSLPALPAPQAPAATPAASAPSAAAAPETSASVSFPTAK